MKLSFFLPTFIASLVCTLASDNVQLWPDEPNYGNPVATVNLLSGVPFANSFNSPYSVQYTPPNVAFSRVALELFVNTTSANYDRLGMAFLNGIEIWRTSTSEPANDNTYWDYSKDVSEFLTLFKQPGEFGFMLNNVIDAEYTGTFEVTVIAKYYQSTDKANTDDSWAITADSPATNIQTFRKSADNLYWTVPSDDIKVTIPQQGNNVNRALLQIFASGNSDDEFWWDTIDGTGSSRFVNAYINEQPAGFAVPFPVIFTGGINAQLWKPLVGIRAYDVPSYFIDVTAFLPSLWSGSSELKVNVSTGLDNNPVPSNWIVNVNLFTWSTDGQQNSGQMSSTPYDAIDIFVNQPASTPHQVALTRTYGNSATLTIGGKITQVGWSQNVSFDNTITYQSSNTSSVVQHCRGHETIVGFGGISRQFSFPLTVEMSPGYYRVQQTYQVVSPVSIYTWIDSSLNVNSDGSTAGTQSSQFIEGASGSHFKKVVNGDVAESW